MEQRVCGQASPEMGIKSCSGCPQIKHYDPSIPEQQVQALTAPLAVSFLAAK